MRTMLATGLLALTCFGGSLSAKEPDDLSQLDRTILREPDYKHQPHYALLVFGEKADHRAWLVVDGDSLAYIDRNGNGDLTDAGEKIELDAEATEEMRLSDDEGPYLALNVFPLGTIAGREFNFHLWIRNPDFDASDNELYRERFREWDAKDWRNGSLMRADGEGSAAQNPLLLTASPEEAQVNWFDGPLTFELKMGDKLRIEDWPKQTLFDVHVGSRNLLARDCDHGGFSFSPLMTNEVPDADGPHPVARFEASSSEGRIVSWEAVLDERCCGDTLYGTFTLPRAFESDKVRVTLAYPDWKEGDVRPRSFTVPINKGLAEHGEAVYIMFGDREIELSDAVNVLRREGISVRVHEGPDRLMIHDAGEAVFAVRLARGESVRKVAAGLGEEHDEGEGLARCSARFEIVMFNPNDGILESAMLARVTAALRELTGGHVYQTWSKQLNGAAAGGRGTPR